jgi:Aminotransferase class I and II
MRPHGGRRGGEARSLVVTDAVFSMDGDVAPLAEIVELAHAFGARVAVDEAHAIGTYGPEGRGALAEAGLEGEVDAIVGTLGKSLGSYGAYVCADEATVRYMLNTARSFIFSTAPSPPATAGALAALELLEERPHRVERLAANARALRRSLASEGFAVAEGDMHIVPLVIGDERDTLRLCQAALEQGVFAQAIRPPTVPSGTSRLRLAAMASHTASDMRLAAGVLAGAARKLGLNLAELGTPADEVPIAEPEAALERPRASAPERTERGSSTPFDIERAARSDSGATHSAPFDIEAPRPRRPPAPVASAAEPTGAPFDGERDGGRDAVAHAA